MVYQVNSSINEIVINQAATSSITGKVEMIDVTYTNNNGTWTSNVPTGYTVETSYFINSDNCVIYTTDDCNYSTITPQPGDEEGGGIIPPSEDEDNTPPEEDEDYPTPICPQDNTICIPYISEDSELSLNFLCNVQRNSSYHHTRCGDNLNSGINIIGSIETLTGNDGICGESIGNKYGNNVVSNVNNGYNIYSIGTTLYKRPYKQYPKVTYVSKDELCDPENSESGYYEIVSGSLDMLKTTCLCYNLYCYWGRYLTAVAGTLSSEYSGINWDGENLSIPSSNTAAIDLINEAIYNYNNNIIVAYFTTITIGEYTRYCTNIVHNDDDPDSPEKIDTPQKFTTFINRFKNNGTQSIVAKKGTEEISSGLTVDEYFDYFNFYSYISNNVNISSYTPLTDGWCKIFSLTSNTDSMIYDNDPTGESLEKTLSTLIIEELESNNKCSQCKSEPDSGSNNNSGSNNSGSNSTESNNCYGYNSDGSFSAIHTNTRFAIISRVPYKYVNNKWEYIYSVKVYNKEKNITFSKTKKSDNTVTKRTFLDYPFSDSSYYLFDDTRLMIKSGLFNTFSKDNSNKTVGGTIYNLIEERITDLNADTEDWNYYKFGDSVHQCSISNA